MNYDHLSKEDLIELYEEIKKKRAYTYEDQLKLTILDDAPFTMWTSDRNCIIKFGSGQCETLYGFKKNDALGKDFVDLFVASEEKLAARRDQIDIIDNGAVFHNIANDIGKNGNTLQLITMCHRIKDPSTGEILNAEMGLIIDFLDQEKERLKAIVQESKHMKVKISQFIEEATSAIEEIEKRKNSINITLYDCEKKATALRKRVNFKCCVLPIRTRLNEIIKDILNEYDLCIIETQSCISLSNCINIRKRFFNKFESISDHLRDLALDVFELSCNFDVEQNYVSDKDVLIKNLSYYGRILSELYHNVIWEIDKEINDYKDYVSPNRYPKSERFNSFIKMRKRMVKLKKKAEHIEEELLIDITSAESKDVLKNIGIKIKNKLGEVQNEMEEIKSKLGVADYV